MVKCVDSAQTLTKTVFKKMSFLPAATYEHPLHRGTSPVCQQEGGHSDLSRSAHCGAGQERQLTHIQARKLLCHRE